MRNEYICRMTRLLAILAACSITLSLNAQQLRMLVGTYTENTSAEGVYLYSFNSKTAQAELLDCAPSGNPSFVIATPDGKRAYAVNEYNDGRQGVSSFILEEKSIVPQSNLLIENDDVYGEDPCNILYLGETIVTSNYTGGSVTAFQLGWDGRIVAMSEWYTTGKQYTHPLGCSPPTCTAPLSRRTGSTSS